MVDALLAFEPSEISYMLSVLVLVVLSHYTANRVFIKRANAAILIGGAEFGVGMLLFFLSVFLIFGLAPFAAILVFVGGATLLAFGSLNIAGGLDRRIVRFIVAPATAFGVLVMGYFFLFSPYQNLKLIETGLPAMAEILDIQPTGNWVNNQPEVRMSLIVRPESGAEYETTKRIVINQVHLPQFQPGNQLKIKYDPDNINRIAVEAVGREHR